MNKIEMKKLIHKNQLHQELVFENINNIDKPLAILIKRKWENPKLKMKKETLQEMLRKCNHKEILWILMFH